MAGTLWLDVATAALRSQEYRYVRGGCLTAAAAGGTLEFERLPKDAWIVRSWRIHAPRSLVADWRSRAEVASVRGTIGRVVEVRGLGVGDPVRFARATADVTGRLVTAEGEVHRVDLSLTLATAAGGPARLSGRVVDGETERPLAGVSVRLGADGPLRIADGHGNFTFPAVPAGTVRLEATLLGYEAAPP